MVQVVAPVGRVMAVSIHIPDMRHIVFLQIRMHILADTYQAVFVPAG